VASNFERFLYFLSDNNSEMLREWMKEFETTGKLVLSQNYLNKARQYIISTEVSDKETVETIAQFHTLGYTLCPHTAVGVKGALQLRSQLNSKQPCFALATAHHSKFGEAVKSALGKDLPLPKELEKLFSLPTKVEVIDNDKTMIKSFINNKTKFKTNKSKL